MSSFIWKQSKEKKEGGKKRDGRGEKKIISSPPIHFPNEWRLDKLKPGTTNSIWVTYLGGSPYNLSHPLLLSKVSIISTILNWKWRKRQDSISGILIWDMNIPSDGLAHCTATMPTSVNSYTQGEQESKKLGDVLVWWRWWKIQRNVKEVFLAQEFMAWLPGFRPPLCSCVLCAMTHRFNGITNHQDRKRP